MIRASSSFAFVLALAWAHAALANEAARDGLGVTVGVTFASAYNFRGLNVYQGGSQHDQSAQLAPWISWALPGTALSFTYWSSYQLNGRGRLELIESGVGAEQDFAAAYAIELSEGLELTTTLNAYLYPFAAPESAGTEIPAYVEPILAVLYEGPIDLGAQVSYLYGVQSAIQDYSYFYGRLSAGTSWKISDTISVIGQVAVGRKLYRADVTDSRYDVESSLAIPIAVDQATIGLSAHWAWTDLSETSFTDEQYAWLALDTSFGM